MDDTRGLARIGRSAGRRRTVGAVLLLVPALTAFCGAPAAIADGSGPQGHDVGSFAFAGPDRLVYDVSVDADDVADDQLWAVDAEGGNRVLLADPWAAGHQLREWLITPDGGWVVFGVADGASCPLDRQSCVSRLWRVPVDGPASAAVPVTPEGYWEWVTWSPGSDGVVDGRLVLLADDAIPIGPLAPARLVSVPVTGGTPTVLSSAPVRSSTVVLPPAGDRIVFAQSTAPEATDAALHSVPVTGGTVSQLSPSLEAGWMGPFDYPLPQVHMTPAGDTVVLTHRASGERRVTARSADGGDPERALTPTLADGAPLEVVPERTWGQVTEPLLLRFSNHLWSVPSDGTSAALLDLGAVPTDALVVNQGTYAVWTNWEQVVAVPLNGPAVDAIDLVGPGSTVHSLDLSGSDVVVGQHEGGQIVLRAYAPGSDGAGVEIGRWNDGSCGAPGGGPCSARSILPVFPGAALVVDLRSGIFGGVWAVNTLFGGTPGRLFVPPTGDDAPGQVVVAPGDPLPRRFAVTVHHAGGESRIFAGELPIDAPAAGWRTLVVSHPPSFVDVGSAHPFVEDITWMAARRITTGFPDGSYRPGESVQRMAMAAFLWRAHGEPASGLEEPFFADVAADHPFFEAIQWMAATGQSTGSPNPGGGKPLFSPSRAVSRQAMAAFLFRAAQEPPSGLSSPFFADVGGDHPFFDAVQWMAGTGLSAGTPNPGAAPWFKPSDPVSRQAMAAFLHRYDELDG